MTTVPSLTYIITVFFLGHHTAQHVTSSKPLCPSLPHGCHCVLNKVNWSNAGMQTVPLLGSHFERFHELILDHNKIQTIHDHVFVNLTALQKLSMAFNRISFVGEKAFYGLTNLQVLSLKGNAVKYLSDDVFRPCPSLAHLSLKLNDFTSFPDNTFLWLPNLQSLDLSYNPDKCTY